jgi:hypothetical protein
MKRILLLSLLTACATKPAPITLCEQWPAHLEHSYDEITLGWTRSAVLRGQYQEVLDLSATFKSPAWRASHAARQADVRGLVGDQRAQHLAQAQADMAGPLEVEMLVTTWDRRENDLDRGKKSVWRVVLVDDQGKEIEPIEIVRDKRPGYTVKAEFPEFGDFTIAYVARFPHDQLLGPDAKSLRLRMSSERGAVELQWVPSVTACPAT